MIYEMVRLKEKDQQALKLVAAKLSCSVEDVIVRAVHWYLYGGSNEELGK